MAYDDDERSIQDSQPIELYEVVTTKGTYRRTSHNTNYTYSSNSYTAIPMSRGGTEVATSSDDRGEMIVTLPASDAIVRDHAFYMPSRAMAMVITRVQRRSGEGKVIWAGRIVGIVIEGKIARLRGVTTFASALDTVLPSVHAQRLCNHALYDARCKMDPEDYAQAATVSAVSSDGRTITVSTVGGNPDQWFKAGQMVRDADGERRLVVDQQGTELVLSAPFPTLIIDEAITMYAGCDHTIRTCHDKFESIEGLLNGNVHNFGGHPFPPPANPFTQSLFALGALPGFSDNYDPD